MTPRTILLKLSGEALVGDRKFGIDTDILDYLSKEISDVKDKFKKIRIAMVVGGGNIWRGADYEKLGMDRSVADSAGMLATMINGLALQDALENINLPVRTMSALSNPSVAELFIRRRALRHLDKGRIVILVGGSGNPYMTTDTAAALRALEISADLLMMSKNDVDGVYDSDPKINPSAKKINKITHIDALSRQIKALDSTALSMCMDNDMPISVFNIFNKGTLSGILSGKDLGTLITQDI
ncbi:MAG: UMP kinase [Dehalococcoidia bacterium]|nr:UMP kinase [Dehalococcoidia bacterium]MEC7920873.1 UMP kinase [Chloroflexota bacterium]MEC9451164.1 UMP kinase [Chloroflexota bacterium]MQG04185.1 UMP kinase [SAR202 cluster bacterium]|tara:strand:- start:5485 stop:6207 length:723 start_codon:yes stop_codon:yes gene_type:complete